MGTSGTELNYERCLLDGPSCKHLMKFTRLVKESQ
jgi:hypothetical protein